MSRGRVAQRDMLEKVISDAFDNKVKIAGKPCACTGVALHPLDGVDHMGDMLHSVSVAGFEGAADIAETMLGIAETNAAGSDGKVSYHLVFFYGDGKEGDRPRKPFKFSVYSSLAAGELGTEEASLKGIVKTVLAREGEMFRAMMSQMNVMQEAAVHMVEVNTRALAEVNEKLDMTKAEREAAIELLVAQRFVLESKAHEYKMEEIDRQGRAQMFSRAVEVGPAIINAFAKKPILPESIGDTGNIKMILADLEKLQKSDPELMMRIIGALSPTTLAALMSRGTQLREAAKEEEAKAAAAIKAAGEAVLGPESPVHHEQHANGSGKRGAS